MQYIIGFTFVVMVCGFLLTLSEIRHLRLRQTRTLRYLDTLFQEIQTNRTLIQQASGLLPVPTADSDVKIALRASDDTMAQVEEWQHSPPESIVDIVNDTLSGAPDR